MGMITQNAVSHLQISAENFGDSEIELRMVFEQLEKCIPWQDRNVARLNARHVDFRQFTRDGGAHTEHFACLSRDQRDRALR